MYFACEGCLVVRPRRVELTPSHIERAMRMRCRTCAGTTMKARASRADYLADEIAWIGGASPEDTAQRLGSNAAALSRLFYRAGRPDLARVFGRAVAAQRRQSRQQRKAAA